MANPWDKDQVAGDKEEEGSDNDPPWRRDFRIVKEQIANIARGVTTRRRAPVQRPQPAQTQAPEQSMRPQPRPQAQAEVPTIQDIVAQSPQPRPQAADTMTMRPVPRPAVADRREYQAGPQGTSSDFVNNVIASLTGTESSGRADAYNLEQGAGGVGHYGLLQFSRARFEEARSAGMVPQGMTIEEFATERNRPVQEAVNRWHVSDIMNRIYSEGLNEYEGQNINGIDVTLSGMIAVAHLGGFGGMRRFLQSNGEYNPADAYGTSLTHYLARHGGQGGTVQGR